jgi:bifunctional non-homologous end joining protein LigD
MKARSAIPGFIEPQLATLSAAMPKGQGWVHEVKFDGYRMLAIINHGKASLISRNGKDWTAAFQPIATMLEALPIKYAILDGEVVVTDAAGRTNFSELKDALSQGQYGRFQYYVFDLLKLNDADLRPMPLLQRKSELGILLDKLKGKSRKHVILSEHFEDKGIEFFNHICSLKMEGIVCKRGDAPYTSGRGKSWLKVKCSARQEFVIGGYVLSTTGREAIGALLLGYYDQGKLFYAGRVGTGWTHNLAGQMWTQLQPLIIAKSPFMAIDALGRRNAVYVKPELVCEVEFSEWTPDGHLRHPSFEGLREDKSALDVKRDFALKPD